MDKTKGMGIKHKIMLAFIVETTLFIILFVFMYGFIGKNLSLLNKMVDATIHINKLNTHLGTAASGLPKNIENFVTDPGNEELLKQIQDDFRVLSETCAILQGVINDNDAKSTLEGIINMIQTNRETFDEIRQKQREKVEFSELSDIYEQIMEITDLTREEVGVLLAGELRSQVTEKALLNKKITATSILVAGILLLFILVSTAGMYLFSAKISTPIVAVTNKLKEISEGGGDLTKEIDVITKDEVGALSRYFNQFVHSLRNMIRNMNSAAQGTVTISNELATISTESASSLEEIRRNSMGMQTKISNLHNEITLSSQHSNDVKKFIREVDETINTQYEAVNRSSEYIKNTSDSLLTLIASSESKIEHVTKLHEMAITGEEIMGENIELINKVGESVNVILQLLKVINTISNQTNLLAMNAAIEAAHAGESGQGFSVVADEIRKLSEETNANAKQMTNSLKDSINFIKSSEAATLKTGTFFKSIVAGIAELNVAFTELKENLGNISKNNADISSSLENVNIIIDTVKKASEQIFEKLSQINTSFETINALSSDTKNGIEEISIGMNELFKVANLTSEVGVKNADNVAGIIDQIGKFKVD